MTVGELYKKLDELYPTSQSCPWDNDGRMVVPDGMREVKKVLCCLDVDTAVVKRAILQGVDLIVSHHPLIFRPLKALDSADPAAAKALCLYSAGIAVFSFHTRFDCGVNGINELLAAAFEMTGVRAWILEGLPMGRIGELPEEMSGREFAALVKQRLGCEALRFVNPEKRVRTVALVGGSGGSYFKEAIAEGADAFLTGEASHHQLLDAGEAGLCLIAAGHDYTERAAARSFCATLNGIDPALELICCDGIALETL